MKPWETGQAVSFWHPPKTAGASIWHNLMRVSMLHGRQWWYRQADKRTIKKNFDPGLIEISESEYSWVKHFPVQKMTIDPATPSILSVRDPYSRCVSMWTYYKKHTYRKINNGILPKDTPIRSFSDFMEKTVYSPKMWNVWRPCSYWRHHLTGHVDIIRYESLKEDFKRVTGEDWVEISKNPTQRWDRERALEVMTDDEIKKISNWFDEDFWMFGYEKV